MATTIPPAQIRSEYEYDLAIEKLNELLDAGGADEAHPLALAVHQLGETIAVYEAHFCSMKITQDVRDYEAAQDVSEQEALQKGMETKAVEFVESGAAVYSKV